MSTPHEPTDELPDEETPQDEDKPFTRQLSPKRRQFTELVASGKGYGEAYHIVYGLENRDVCNRLGSRLMTKDAVIHYLQELREPIAGAAVLSLDEKRRLLAEVISIDAASLIHDDGTANIEAIRRLPKHAVQGFTITTKHDKHGNPIVTVKLELLDKLKAIEVDNALAGHGKQDAGLKKAATLVPLESARESTRARVLALASSRRAAILGDAPIQEAETAPLEPKTG